MDSLDLRLEFVGWNTLTSENWTLGLTRSSFWRFYYHTSPGASVCFEDTTTDMAPERAYIIPAYTPFTTACTGKPVQFFVHFDLPGLMGVTLRHRLRGMVEVPGSGEFIRQVKGFMDHTVSGSGDAITDIALFCSVKSMLYDSFSRILSGLAPGLPEAKYGKLAMYNRLLPALGIIHASPDSNLKTDALARACCMSSDHLARCFKECMGMTLTQYRRWRRINAAERLLLTTEDTMEAIAEATGFGSRAYFSRVFESVIGMPPGAYRRAGNG